MKIDEPYFITKSKQLCKESGMDPDVVSSPKHFLSESALATKRESYNEILQVVRFFIDKLLKSLEGTPLFIVISDAEGYLLEMAGDSTIQQMIESLGIKNGSLFRQEDTGTNVISLTLQEQRPISLIGDNHYHTFLHGVACYGAVFTYTDEDHLLGSVCIMMPYDLRNPLYLTMLTQVVDSIERELLLRKQNHKLNIMNQIMLSRTRNGVVITDEFGVTTEFNEFAEKISNKSRESVVGRSILESELTGSYFKLVIQEEKKFENVELSFLNDHGEQVVCLFDAQPIYNGNKMIGAFGQFRDITERYLMQEKYNYLAFHDDLTSLPNRRFIQQDMEQIIDAHNPDDQLRLAVLFMDIDRFKVINDTFGHSKGDLLLQDVAQRLQDCIGPNTKLGRMGGDEFIFVVKDYTREEDVVRLADQIISQFSEPFMVSSNEIHITTSIGISFYPDTPVSYEAFMVTADTAMYEAKSRGKNRYIIYTSDMYESSMDKLKLESDLRHAVTHNELVLHYQPQFSNKTGEIMGVEALIRWQHPSRGLIYPDQFIWLAEESGLIFEIGKWVITEACRQNKAWQDHGCRPIQMSVNLSSKQFFRSDLVDFVKDVLEETEMPPCYLVLEITESMAMDADYARHVLKRLKELGVCISIDDFGKGYSSLVYLKTFPIDSLKIDKSFVKDITNDDDDVNIVKAIIMLAHNLGLQVIAEGVETKEQLDLLKSYECDEVQGYLLSRPITAEQFHDTYESLVNSMKNLYE